MSKRGVYLSKRICLLMYFRASALFWRTTRLFSWVDLFSLLLQRAVKRKRCTS